MKVLFCDSDFELKHFFKAHCSAGLSYVFEKSSFNQMSDIKIAQHCDADILCVFAHSSLLSNQRLDLFKNLKLIATRSTGLNHIDLDYCAKRGIQVANVPYYGAQTVAEYTFGLLLNLSRHISLAHQDMIHNQFNLNSYIGFDLYGKTIGIIGTGSIGRHMIQLALGFGMNVMAYDVCPNKHLEHYYVPLTSLFKHSDIISLHIPSTPQNYHLLNQAAFAQMKKGVYILNTARGDLIDTQALYDAIQKGHVAGAGLDVLENEDILLHDDIVLNHQNTSHQILLDSTINFKLIQHPHVLATPHIAFNTHDALNRILQATFENIRHFMKRNPL